MQISIANAIQVARRIGAAAAEVITTNLKMWLGFETSSIDGDNQITPDKSGNNNVGELFTGKALEFDGSGDNVDIDFTTPVKSAVFWVKPLDTGLENIMWFGGAFAGTKSIKSNGNVIQTSGLSSVSIYVNGVQTTSVPLNQWSRVVVNFASVTPSELKFGYAFNSYGYIQLSNVQFYNETWSADDIAYDYANPQNLVTDRDGTSIGLSNLKGYWALSEGDGLVAYDSSGEGNNGTINGATYVPAQPRIPQLGMINWSKGSNLLTYSEDFNQWVKTNVGISSSSIDSPIGTNNVDYFVPTTTTGSHIIKLTTASLSNDKVISINVKVDSAINKVTLFPGGSNTFANFDLSNLTSTKESNVVSTNIVDLGSSWYRLEAVYNSAITLDRFQFYASSGSIGASSTTENGTNGINIWGAQLVEGASVSAYRLTDGAVTSNSTVIPNPTIPTKDIFGNAVRDRLNSFNLDGSGYAEVADDTDLDFGTGDFTLECWAQYDFLNQGSGFNVLVSNGSMSSSGSGLSLGSSITKFEVRLNAGTAITKSFGTDNMTIGNWYHLVVTREGTRLKTYRDTTIKSSSIIASVNVDTSLPVRIGRDTTTTRFYQNLISDVRLYDRALTSDEVENNYNAGLSAHTNN